MFVKVDVDSSETEKNTEQKKDSKWVVFLELTIFWLLILIIIRVVVMIQDAFGLPEWILGIVPLLFIYGPVLLCNIRGVDSWSYPLSIPAFRDIVSWRDSFWECMKLNLVIWPPFLIFYHFWNSILFSKSFIGTLPEELLLTILYQLFFVAIPEEFFYRGYFQTRLNEVYPKDWNIFGTKMGGSTIYTGIFFAFGHSIVTFQWWHFSIFFPSLLFSYLREKTDGILSAAMFHASCNVGIVILDTLYGIRSPI